MTIYNSEEVYKVIALTLNPDFRSFYVGRHPTAKYPPPVDHPDTYKPSAVGEGGYMEETAARAARDAGDVLIFIEHTPWEIERAVLGSPVEPPVDPPVDPPAEPWRTEFGGGSLPAGWTFAQNGTSNATLTHDDGAVLTIPAGTISDTINSTSTPDDSAGLVTNISGDFDIAVRISTRYSGDDSTMFGFILRGATDAQMIRFQVYANGTASSKYGYERFDGAGAVFISGLLPSNTYLLGNPHWLRVTRSGTTYTFYCSTDGVTWNDETGPLVSSVDASTLKISLGQYSAALGSPVRIDEVVDLLAAGKTDARKAAVTPTKGTTESTDFATMPSWLTLSSQVDGSAVHSAGKISLSTASADGSRGVASYTGTGYSEAGLLVSCQIPVAHGDAYFVPGLAVDDGGPQIDVYSNGPGYINEVKATPNPVSKALSVHRPISNDAFNEPYTYLGPSPALGGTTFHYRLEKFGSRFRLRHWADSDPEPSDWNVYDGEIDTLRGEGLIKPYFSIGHNPGSPAPATLDLLNVEFYALV